MTEEEKIEKLTDLVRGSDNIVFFGGAGVSTESGIPDFRSEDGLYHQKYKYPPEEMLSHTFYEQRPEEFFKFYRDKLLLKGQPKPEPNMAHKILAKWEKEGKLKAVITQNIDGLHQKAGSKKVLELHGSTLRNYCENCHAFYDADFIANSEGIPTCTKCGGRVKPDVVLYEESRHPAMPTRTSSLRTPSGRCSARWTDGWMPEDRTAAKTPCGGSQCMI